MQINKINLRDFSGMTQKITEVKNQEILKSDDPEIDGTLLTTNNDIKYRRKRIVSNVKPYKRTYKIQELLNYCKFKVGLIPTCSKPPKIVFKVLADYKYKRLDSIPQAYLEVIKLNEELVEQAINIDLRLTKKKIKAGKRKQNTLTINGLKITTNARKDQTIKCAEEFIEWLNTQETIMPSTIESPDKYLAQICFYLKNKKSRFLRSAISQVLKQKPWIIENYHFEKKGKKNILAKNSCSISAQKIETIKLPQNAIIKEAVPKDIENFTQILPMKEDTINKVNDTLSMIITLAKKSGATELIIKL